MADKLLVFAHGKESGPWGTKILRLAQVAKTKGFCVESPDYSGIDDLEQRCRRLLALNPKAEQALVLVGSSMGAAVSVAVSEQLKPDGLFLMAPAVMVEGVDEKDITPYARFKCLVHGWQDEVIDVQNAIRFAQQYDFDLHIYHADHRLISVLDEIEGLFARFLEAVSALPEGKT